MDKEVLQNLDVTMVKQLLDHLLESYRPIRYGWVSVSPETKKALQSSIKELCNTISEWVDLDP